ncbi:hypothetical protein D9M72_632040 [compost metagenome]
MFDVHSNPGLEVAVAFALGQQRIAGVDQQIDQHLLELIHMPAHLHRCLQLAHAQLHAFAAQAFAEQ